MRIFNRRHEPVDDTDQQHAGEKGNDRKKMPHTPIPNLGKRLQGLHEQLDERNVNHHPARKPERKREQPFIGVLSKKGDGAADAGRQTGAERQQKRDDQMLFHRIGMLQKGCYLNIL